MYLPHGATIIGSEATYKDVDPNHGPSVNLMKLNDQGEQGIGSLVYNGGPIPGVVTVTSPSAFSTS